MFGVSVFFVSRIFGALMRSFPQLNNVKLFDYKFKSPTVGWWLTEDSFYLSGKPDIVQADGLSREGKFLAHLTCFVCLFSCLF